MRSSSITTFRRIMQTGSRERLNLPCIPPPQLCYLPSHPLRARQIPVLGRATGNTTDSSAVYNLLFSIVHSILVQSAEGLRKAAGLAEEQSSVGRLAGTAHQGCRLNGSLVIGMSWTSGAKETEDSAPWSTLLRTNEVEN